MNLHNEACGVVSLSTLGLVELCVGVLLELVVCVLLEVSLVVEALLVKSEEDRAARSTSGHAGKALLLAGMN